MEEICNLPSTKEEIKINDIQCIKIEKSKRKRSKKGAKRFLILLTVIVIAFAIAFNYEAIQGYWDDIYASFTSETDSTLSDNTDIDTEEADTDVPAYSFHTSFVEEYETVNETDLQINLDDTVQFPNKALILEKHGENAPIILIVSHSPKEAYSTCEGYSSYEEFYSDSKNVFSIGTEICKKLNELGIPALQLPLIDTSSVYEGNSAYKEAIEKALTENPSIAFVLDISRSIELNDDSSISKKLTTINGSTVPAIELWCGTNGRELDESRLKSILFCNHLSQSYFGESQQLISRTTVSKYTLLQEFNAICFRADVGSFAVRYEDALLSAILFAEQLASIINT